MNIYVVTDDGKVLRTFQAELVETNLVEVGIKISEHKWSKVLPNWLNLLIPKRAAPPPASLRAEDTKRG